MPSPPPPPPPPPPEFENPRIYSSIKTLGEAVLSGSGLARVTLGKALRLDIFLASRAEPDSRDGAFNPFGIIN